MRYFYTFSVFMLLLCSSCTYYFTNSRANRFNRQTPDFIPSFEQRPTPLPLEKRIQLDIPLIEQWAKRELGKRPKKHDKRGEPKIMIAKLLLKKDIKKTNDYIQSLVPWGNGGSSWKFNKKGDYDFDEINLINLLYLLEDQPDVLYPETAKHIAEVLIIENGHKPKTRTPKTLGIIRDTENHILMKEVSRYLKNQWLYKHKQSDEAYDNTKNGLEDWLYKHLVELEETGFYEFNADPYIGYTLIPLLTLQAFAKTPKIKLKARHVLDLANWDYALGSLSFRKFSPFRRRLENAKMTALNDYPHTSFFQAWMNLFENQATFNLAQLPHNRHMAYMGLILPYQLPNSIVDFLENRPEDYFIKIGHGLRASPEVYSGGQSFLLSAGGVQRGKKSQIVARATTLFLEDGALDLKDCFHSKGKGEMKTWNNTGVYHHFACSNAPFHIPANYKAANEKDGWKIFNPLANNPLRVAIYEENRFGLLVLFPTWEGTSNELLEKIIKANPYALDLSHSFRFPNETTLSYDLHAPKNRWVIKSVDGKKVNRKYDKWPRWIGAPAPKTP